MHGIDLNALDSNAFERMVRALAFAQMGGGGTVFSSGPDGARDFVYDGIIPGFEGRAWSGYLVLQAKFKERPLGGAPDVAWLEKQLKGELEKFKDKKRNLKRPDYYLLATNVALSGADSGGRQGGMAKINAILEDWKKIGVRDFHIWSADQIVDLLAVHNSVRQTFGAWVTSGDVITSLADNLNLKQRHFGTIILRALRTRLAVDQFVPLNESGSIDHKKIPTSKVFTDLPVRSSERASDPSEHEEGFVRKIMRIGKSKFDLEEDGPLAPARQRSPSRIVLLGGPGQGKSTTGLFAVQLCRALALKRDPTSASDPAVAGVLPEIIERAQKQKIDVNIPRRFPVHVSLPAFADKISEKKRLKEDSPSLLSYITQEIGRASDTTIDREDMRAWLGSYPWLVVLDGLDEVPPSGERPAVIEAVNNFASEVHSTKADALIIVTSRPQGYNKDLDERYWSHWNLTDLPKEVATAYADALSLAQHPMDSDRRAKIAVGLDKAMQQQVTARLMVSPLQVTIMHLIVDGGGSAPVGRWALFNEYYQVLKKREKAKGGETQEVLERNWDHLDPVHHRAGLVLQAQSEISGGAAPAFTRTSLKALINGYLRTCGYDEASRDSRSEELARLALNRMVLLSMRQQGQTDDDGLINFDVRSLQEFMAAAEITTEIDQGSSPPEKQNQPKIEERLTHLAAMSHWRHAFLIAASRCFSETALHHLRSVVVSIPRSLDASDPYNLSKKGAYLALEMLSDGIATNHPISACKLVEHAMEILDLGPDAYDAGLSQIWNADTSAVFEERLIFRLTYPNSPAWFSSWKLLMDLCNKGPEKFVPLARSLWPRHREDQIKILENVGVVVADGMKDLVMSALAKSAPSDLRRIGRAIRPDIGESLAQAGDQIMSLLHLIATRGYRRGHVGILHREPTFRFHLTRLSEWHSETPSISGIDWNPKWKLFKFVSDFVANPSAESLSDCLTNISSNALWEEARNNSTVLPWVIESILPYCDNDTDIRHVSDLARVGKLGDHAEWVDAEKRWIEQGITHEDFLSSPRTQQFSELVGTVGAPKLSHYSFSDDGKLRLAIKDLAAIAREVNNKIVANDLITLAVFGLMACDDLLNYSASELLSILEMNFAEDERRLDINVFRHLSRESWQDRSAVERVVKLLARSEKTIWADELNYDVMPIAQAFNRFPDLRLLLICVVAGLFNDSPADLSNINLIESATEFFEQDEPSIVAAVATLRVLLKNDYSEPNVRKMLSTLGASTVNFAKEVCDCNYIPQEAKEKLCCDIIRICMELRQEDASDFRIILKRLLDARKSGITSREMWVEKLGFPLDAFSVLSEKTANA